LAPICIDGDATSWRHHNYRLGPEAGERLGNWLGWSLATKIASGRLSDPTGRNASEAWAGPENDNADVDPPANWGRRFILPMKQSP